MSSRVEPGQEDVYHHHPPSSDVPQTDRDSQPPLEVLVSTGIGEVLDYEGSSICSPGVGHIYLKVVTGVSDPLDDPPSPVTPPPLCRSSPRPRPDPDSEGSATRSAFRLSVQRVIDETGGTSPPQPTPSKQDQRLWSALVCSLSLLFCLSLSHGLPLSFSVSPSPSFYVSLCVSVPLSLSLSLCLFLSLTFCPCVFVFSSLPDHYSPSTFFPLPLLPSLSAHSGTVSDSPPPSSPGLTQTPVIPGSFSGSPLSPCPLRSVRLYPFRPLSSLVPKDVLGLFLRRFVSVPPGPSSRLPSGHTRHLSGLDPTHPSPSPARVRPSRPRRSRGSEGGGLGARTLSIVRAYHD